MTEGRTNISITKPADIPERITWAVSQLNVSDGQSILEIGCGGGHAAGLIHHCFPNSHITAIDKSAKQIAIARGRLANGIASGSVAVRHMTLSEASADSDTGRFDRIFAINVNVFWTHAPESVTALRALLKRGGEATLVFELPPGKHAAPLRAHLSEQAGANGFSLISVTERAIGKAEAIAFRLR